MRLPKLTAKGYVVLRYLVGKGVGVLGKELREELRGQGVEETRVNFYQGMKGLEREGLVEGWYEQVPMRERLYRATADGVVEYEAAREFYCRG
jgi:hypothetical protein